MEPSKIRKPAGNIWNKARSILTTLLFVWLITHHIAQATVVPTESMTPTILVGDHFILDKVAFSANYPDAIERLLPARSIKRGEIIAFWSPKDSTLRLVKRVIGLPGDTIEIRDKQVYIDGIKLDEPYAVFSDVRQFPQRDNMLPTKVPADSFFMMGDNRDNSNDSRFWGFAQRKDLIGTPLFVYWSYDSEPYRPNMTIAQTAERYGSVALHFFTRTRWYRTGIILR
jgi:signal peptidase I